MVSYVDGLAQQVVETDRWFFHPLRPVFRDYNCARLNKSAKLHPKPDATLCNVTRVMLRVPLSMKP